MKTTRHELKEGEACIEGTTYEDGTGYSDVHMSLEALEKYLHSTTCEGAGIPTDACVLKINRLDTTGVYFTLTVTKPCD